MSGSDLLGLIVAGALGAVFAVELAVRIDLLSPVKALLASSKQSMKIMGDSALPEDEKSKQLLAHSKALLLASFGMILRMCAVLAVFALLAAGVLALFFNVEIGAAIASLADWRMQLTALLVAIVYLRGRRHVSGQL